MRAHPPTHFLHPKPIHPSTQPHASPFFYLRHEQRPAAPDGQGPKQEDQQVQQPRQRRPRPHIPRHARRQPLHPCHQRTQRPRPRLSPAGRQGLLLLGRARRGEARPAPPPPVGGGGGEAVARRALVAEDAGRQEIGH
jgi:hypothetical protein